MTMSSQFADMPPSSNILDVAMFLLSSLATDPIFMPISLLVLELIFVYKGLPKNLEIGDTSVWVKPIFGGWNKSRILNLAENQQGWGGRGAGGRVKLIKLTPTILRLKEVLWRPNKLLLHGLLPHKICLRILFCWSFGCLFECNHP